MRLPIWYSNLSPDVGSSGKLRQQSGRMPAAWFCKSHKPPGNDSLRVKTARHTIPYPARCSPPLKLSFEFGLLICSLILRHAPHGSSLSFMCRGLVVYCIRQSFFFASIHVGGCCTQASTCWCGDHPRSLCSKFPLTTWALTVQKVHLTTFTFLRDSLY